MFSLHFWQLTVERAVKTFAQSLLALLSADGVGLLAVPWLPALSTAGAAALLSVLTSMGSAPVGQPNSPSLLPVHPAPVPAEVKTSVPASRPRVVSSTEFRES